MVGKIGVIFILSLIGGVLGRLGGKEGFNTKYRDIGVALIICLILGLYGQIRGIYQWLSLIPCFGAMWGALTTYRYFLPKPKDYTWIHYSLHGFMVAFACVFYAWAFGHWLWFGIRCLVCAGLVGLWSKLISWDDLEEWGRYFIISLSTILLLI